MKKIMKSIKIYEYSFPLRRSFQWKVFIVLVILYFLGNLAGVPLLRRTNTQFEPIGFWGIATFISAIIIALSLLMANRTSLGAPLLEGRIAKVEFSKWMRTGFSLTVFLIVIGVPLTLLANRNVNPAEYPFGWELLPASLKAGIVEEILNRFFFVSLFVWFGSLLKRNRNDEGRPKRRVYWISILIAALLFGWAHVDARLGHPTATFWDYFLIMALNLILGFYFGWLYWILGLEWAMIAHFIYDVFVSMVLIPVYMLKSPIALVILTIVLILGCGLSWRMLISASQD
jgi:hypothetical protein